MQSPIARLRKEPRHRQRRTSPLPWLRRPRRGRHACGKSRLRGKDYNRRQVSRQEKAVVPPGASSRDSFLSHCTACHLCVSKCPQGIIRPSATEYGILHMLQPHLDYSLGYCLHECNLCTQVCPDGALKPLSLGEKQSHAVGKAKFVLKTASLRPTAPNADYAPANAL